MSQHIAFVTGAMGGLGTAICQEMAKAGHKVVASYHPQFDNKDEWLKEMAAAGFNDFVCVAGDVSSLEDCQKMVAEAEAAPVAAAPAPSADDTLTIGVLPNIGLFSYKIKGFDELMVGA